MDNQGKNRRKRTQRDYTLGFKLYVVGQVESGEFTYKQAQRHYGIQGRSTVLVWLRKHGMLDWSPKPVQPSMGKHKHKETPAERIKRLEQQLKDERAKNRILSRTIDIVEQEHGVPVRKKYFPRQSGGPKKPEK